MNSYSTERIPFGQLGVIALESCTDLGNSINYHLMQKKNNL